MTYMDYAQSGLAAVLAALERELLAAPADEVREATHQTGRARNIACQEVRALLSDAIAASDEDSAAPLLRNPHPGLDRLLDVSDGLRATGRYHPHAGTFPVASCRRH
jgi:CelD/BcsL family acetyltransferase involved in cellulose biosynthesis